MKLSPITLKILQYFSRLSEFIYFNVDNKGFISVNNESRDLYCYYNLSKKEREINEFVLYHYNEILEMMKILNEEKMVFEFDDKKLIIKDDKTIFSYLYANKELIRNDKKLLSLPEIKLEDDKIFLSLPKTNIENDINFKIGGKELFKLNKILKSMKMDDFLLIFKKGEMYISSSNQTKTKNFKQKLLIENLQINKSEDFQIKMFISALRDLNFSLDYKVIVFSKMKLIALNGIVNIKKEDSKELFQKEIPLVCLLFGKK